MQRLSLKYQIEANQNNFCFKKYSFCTHLRLNLFGKTIETYVSITKKLVGVVVFAMVQGLKVRQSGKQIMGFSIIPKNERNFLLP